MGCRKGNELILIVEDEPTIAEAIASRFRSEGFATEVVGDGIDAVDRCASVAPDLVVLDLNLPRLDGVEVCRRIQVHRHVPVIMLTARDDETDMLDGLDVGADDYLTKPFSLRELVARTRAVLRRAQGPIPATGNDGGGPGHSLHIDQATRRVHQHGIERHLTPTEFDLLVALTQAAGSVLRREQLLATVWGYRDGSGTRTVDSHIRALRSKLDGDVIRTVNGVGYGFNRPAERPVPA